MYLKDILSLSLYVCVYICPFWVLLVHLTSPGMASKDMGVVLFMGVRVRMYMLYSARIECCPNRSFNVCVQKL